MTQTNYQFITRKDPLYQEAVALRSKLFFDTVPHAAQLINDAFENTSIHLVAVQNAKVIGTGRLHLEATIGVISQMAIAPSFQNQRIGQHILRLLIEKCKSLRIATITLSARSTAIDFYAKFGFNISSAPYPSKKTGVMHQKMILALI